MVTLVKTYENDKVNGIWLLCSSEQSIYIPFGLALAIADSITFDDNDSGPYKLIGYIELYFDYDGGILLSDGMECVRIEKHEIIGLKNELWSMI